MRKLSAHYIYPANQPPLKYGTVILDDDGQIIDLIDTGGILKEEANLEFYPGILMPGFVNSHCHLELSHMLGIIPQQTGITSFINHVNKYRLEEKDKIEHAVRKYSEEMYRYGTSAIADIVNSDHTIQVKKESMAYWHSFVELFGLNSGLAKEIWQSGTELQNKYKESDLSASICPHAPYSLSKNLWRLFNLNPQEIISIHNQESPEEEELMSARTGEMADWFNEKGFDSNNLPSTGRSSLESIINYLPDSKRVMLVHNTMTDKNDIKLAIERFGRDNIYWVLCPKANLYIENMLPKEIIINRENLHICLGTDSLASNSQLSILEEMKTIQEHFPTVKLEDLIRWGSLNGAKALGIDEVYGSFEIGKKPGVVWIKNISFPDLRLGNQSKSLRLV